MAFTGLVGLIMIGGRKNLVRVETKGRDDARSVIDGCPRRWSQGCLPAETDRRFRDKPPKGRERLWQSIPEKNLGQAHTRSTDGLKGTIRFDVTIIVIGQFTS